MKAKKKQRLINAICVAALIIGGYLTATDGIKRHFHGRQADQYLFNFCYMCLVMPACICLSDICERSHPEYFTTDELRRKGLIK